MCNYYYYQKTTTKKTELCAKISNLAVRETLWVKLLQYAVQVRRQQEVQVGRSHDVAPVDGSTVMGAQGSAQNEQSCGQAVGIRILSIGGRTSYQAEFYWSESYSIDDDSRSEIRFQPSVTKTRGYALRATETQRTNGELFPNSFQTGSD